MKRIEEIKTESPRSRIYTVWLFPPQCNGEMIESWIREGGTIVNSMHKTVENYTIDFEDLIKMLKSNGIKLESIDIAFKACN